jgi:uncharacterized SAM-binding protein YcdF (DUF218 family)
MLIWLILLISVFSLFVVDNKKNYFKLLMLFNFLIIFLGSSQYSVSFLIDVTEVHTRIENPEFGTNNLIILLTAGHVTDRKNNILPHFTADSRTFEALQTLNKCRSVVSRHCKLVISGGDPQGLGQSEARTTLNKLFSLGADTSTIILEENSLNTENSALYIAEIVKKENPDKIFVVTSGYHTQRSQLWFEHNGIKPVMLPSDHLSASGPWWLPRPYNLLYAEICLREIAGMIWMKLKTQSF